jgi:hypothetical protein
MRYYKLTYKHRMMPNATVAQDQRTYAPESLRRHLLHMFRGMADNERHVRVDVTVDNVGMPIGAIVWHKLTSERTGMWVVWERVSIARV